MCKVTPTELSLRSRLLEYLCLNWAKPEIYCLHISIQEWFYSFHNRYLPRHVNLSEELSPLLDHSPHLPWEEKNKEGGLCISYRRALFLSATPLFSRRQNQCLSFDFCFSSYLPKHDIASNALLLPSATRWIVKPFKNRAESSSWRPLWFCAFLQKRMCDLDTDSLCQ